MGVYHKLPMDHILIPRIIYIFKDFFFGNLFERLNFEINRNNENKQIMICSFNRLHWALYVHFQDIAGHKNVILFQNFVHQT
jgi:hypothetical protein